MKRISAKITACVLSAAMAAGMMSACTPTGESGAKDMLLTAFDSMSKSASKSWSAMTDNADGRQSAAKGSVTFDPGEYLDELVGTDVKEISVSMDSKIKGGISGTTYGISYDGKPISDMDMVLDASSKTVYIKYSDLSDKYIKVPIDELTSGTTNDDFFDDEMPNIEFDDIINAGKAFDVKGIVSDVDKIIDEINKTIPESDDEGERTIKENGVEAVFTTKTVTITKDDDAKTEKAVKEALKKSENIKAFVSKLDDDYDKLIDDMFESVDDDESSDNEKITFYYYDDKLVGFGEDNKNYFLSADTKEGFIETIKVDDEETGKVQMALTAVPDDEKLDIEFKCTVEDLDLEAPIDIINNQPVTLELKVDDFEIVNSDTCTYNALVECNFPVALNDSNKSQDCKIKAECKGEDNKQNVSGDITINDDGKDKSVLKFTEVVENTDASDIKVPEDSECVGAENAGSIFEGEAAQEWLNKIKDALGEELVTKITEKFAEMYSYDDYVDYDSDNLLFDLQENYGIDYYDYYNDTYTEFDMDKFLSDAKKVYPADKFDDLKDEIEEEYEYGLTSTPNIDTLYSDYDIDIDDYFDDNYSSFDKDKFMEDAKKVYPKDKLEELEDEADDYAELMKEMMSSLSGLAS